MQQFQTGHKDLVLAIAYNLYGTRLATAGADHLLKVWHHDPDTSQWSPTDTWIAHDAEVTDVKWTYPFPGEHIGSISEDGTLKLWAEDVSQSLNSGRRFTKFFVLNTLTGVPFMSLDFKSIGIETYLAAITRDGSLIVCEPEEQGGKLSAWKTMWSDYLVRTPSRMDETSFRLSWHKEKLPAWPAVFAGLDRKSLALAVSIGETVRIFRTDKYRKFYNAALLEGAKDLIRDVDWANGSVRGFDIIATACKDGFVRVYELHTPDSERSAAGSNGVATAQSTPAMQPVRSGIGAGLAVRPHKHDGEPDTPGAVTQDVKLVAELETHSSMPWRVVWSFVGDQLISTGDDGTVRFWKKSVEGKWLEALEIDAIQS